MQSNDHESEDWKPKCWDCERRMARRNLQTREVMVTHDDGLGYDMVPVPICPHCIGKRFGYDCPQCGIHHDDRESAEYCCRRRPGEAPDCPECGRRMKRTAWGYAADGEPSVECAECEACGVFWGRFTGFSDLEESDQ